MTDSKRRIEWIDTARGLAMIAILYFHTEMYYAGYDVISYNFYVENALIGFLFISGYLFYKNTPFNIKKKIISILRGIVMPYFIFATVLALPKAIVNDNLNSVSDLIINILKGHASWFVTALAVAEIIFSILLSIPAKYGRYILPIASIICTVVVFYGRITNIWNFDIALLSIIFIYCGYLFHKFEHYMNKIYKPIYNIAIFAVILFLKWYEYDNEFRMLVCPISITSFPIFFIDTIFSTILLINISKYLPKIKLILFTGTNSIVYYFLSGGVPMIIGKIFNIAGLSYNGNHALIIIVFCIVYTIATLITFFIMKYIPFITGKKFN